MPTFVNIPMPIQSTRQFSGPLDVDMVFSTTAARNTYLTSPRRFAGMIVTDVEQDGAAYSLNAAMNAWNPIGSNNIALGLGSSTFSITFTGAAGLGAVGAVTIPTITIPIGAFIAFAWADIGGGLTTVDGTSYIELGVGVDDTTAAMDNVIGLVSALNAQPTGVTGNIEPRYTKATASRQLVMNVAGSNITAGTITIIVVITDQLVSGSGGGGGGVNTIYTADDSLVSNRNINLVGYSLQITSPLSSGDPLFHLDPVNVISSLSTSDATSEASLFLSAKTGVDSQFQLYTSDSSTSIAIELIADAIAGTFAFNSPNKITFTGYGSGGKTGTPTYGAAWDASGNFVEAPTFLGVSNGIAISTVDGTVEFGGEAGAHAQLSTHRYTDGNGVNIIFIGLGTLTLTNSGFDTELQLTNTAIQLFDPSNIVDITTTGIGIQTVTGSNQLNITDSYLQFVNNGGTHNGYLSCTNFTINRSIHLPDQTGNVAIVNTGDNYINDAAAATGGILVGQCYHTAGAVKIRLT